MMEVRQVLEQMYTEMYRAMIAKDTIALGDLLTHSFVLVHMTGMRQSKSAFLQAISGGILNYYSCDDTRLDISVDGNRARIVGRSRVEAAVFGGGRHVWALRLDIDAVSQDGQWKIAGIQAGTFAG
ncbi:MAG: nuclear transport factor 2 family protein [Coprobacter sp.]|nr:nuclear transport factor 2 family protein [Coprobacter sp.]